MITSIPPRSNSEKGCGSNFLLFSSRTLASILNDFDFEEVFIRVLCNHLDSSRKMGLGRHMQSGTPPGKRTAGMQESMLVQLYM